MREPIRLACILRLNFANILQARLEFRLSLLELGKRTGQVIQFLDT